MSTAAIYAVKAVRFLADRGPGKGRPLLERSRQQWGRKVRAACARISGFFVADHALCTAGGQSNFDKAAARRAFPATMTRKIEIAQIKIASAEEPSTREIIGSCFAGDKKDKLIGASSAAAPAHR